MVKNLYKTKLKVLWESPTSTRFVRTEYPKITIRRDDSRSVRPFDILRSESGRARIKKYLENNKQD